MGAVEDNRRLCEFIYRNLGRITHITATLDTHTAMQIFHPIFLVDSHGQNPAPLTLISYEDILKGVGSSTLPSRVAWKSIPNMDSNTCCTTPRS